MYIVLLDLYIFQIKNEAKKHAITHFYIKLPDVFMKEMKRKLKFKYQIFTSIGAIKIYLVVFESSLIILEISIY